MLRLSLGEMHIYTYNTGQQHRTMTMYVHIVRYYNTCTICNTGWQCRTVHGLHWLGHHNMILHYCTTYKSRRVTLHNTVPQLLCSTWVWWFGSCVKRLHTTVASQETGVGFLCIHMESEMCSGLNNIWSIFLFHSENFAIWQLRHAHMRKFSCPSPG